MQYPENIIIETNAFALLNGGYLLYRMIWHYKHAVNQNENYMFSNFGRNVIIIDGYHVWIE